MSVNHRGHKSCFPVFVLHGATIQACSSAKNCTVTHHKTNEPLGPPPGNIKALWMWNNVEEHQNCPMNHQVVAGVALCLTNEWLKKMVAVYCTQQKGNETACFASFCLSSYYFVLIRQTWEFPKVKPKHHNRPLVVKLQYISQKPPRPPGGQSDPNPFLWQYRLCSVSPKFSSFCWPTFRRSWSSSTPRVTNRFLCSRMTLARRAASRSSSTNTSGSLSRLTTTWREPKGPSNTLYLAIVSVQRSVKSQCHSSLMWTILKKEVLEGI